jgi:hypothetical protein
MKMTCKKCGYSQDIHYCSNCGASFEEEKTSGVISKQDIPGPALATRFPLSNGKTEIPSHYGKNEIKKSNSQLSEPVDTSKAKVMYIPFSFTIPITPELLGKSKRKKK